MNVEKNCRKHPTNTVIPPASSPLYALLFALLCGLAVSNPAFSFTINLEPLVTGLDNPVVITNAGDDRLFVAEKSGTIRIIDNGDLLPTPYLDLTNIVGSEYIEQGLLGIAFHPDYGTAGAAGEGLFWVNYTDKNGDTVIARYSVSANNPNVADPASSVVLFNIAQVNEDHNGGHIEFGPPEGAQRKRYLYIGMGDGGRSANGQEDGTLLGKLLRIDPSTDSTPNAPGYTIPPDNPNAAAAAPLGTILAKGFRNPWRFSFDAANGDLYITDVGQKDWEEINIQTAGTVSGKNFGWNIMEGVDCYSPATGCVETGLEPPTSAYAHDSGRCAIIGGHVYRGPKYPGLAGNYLYADWCSGELFALKKDSTGEWISNPVHTVSFSPLSFGVDRAQELYLAGSDGTIYQVVDADSTGNTNSLPVARDDSANTRKGEAVVISALANDSDPDGDVLTIGSVTQGAHGDVMLNPDGSITYTPNDDYTGSDTFNYTVSDGNGGSDTAAVSIRVIAVNSIPVANADTVTVKENTKITITPLTNDLDADNDPLTITDVSQATAGTVSMAGNNAVDYMPALNYTGADQFTYSIEDGNGGTATATVSITVTAVNSAPVDRNDSASTSEDSAVTIAVLDNDNDPDNDLLRIGKFTQAAHGSVRINEDSSITYTPAANFHGSDSFSYTVTDGELLGDGAIVSIQVSAANDAPTAQNDAADTRSDSTVAIPVLANDDDADGDSLQISAVTAGEHGTVTIDGDALTYQPATGFVGTDRFTYTIVDGRGGSDTAEVVVQVDRIVIPLSVQDDHAQTDKNTPVAIAVLDNDSCADGCALTVRSVTQGLHGNVVINTDNTLSYTPDADFIGEDRFEYTIHDDSGLSATAAVTVNISETHLNTPPVIDPIDVPPLSEGNTTSVPITARDPEGDQLRFSASQLPEFAKLIESESGAAELIFEAGHHHAGSYSLTITVTDNGNPAQSSSVTLQFVVRETNRAPVAQLPEDMNVPTGTRVVLDATDSSDPDNDLITFQWKFISLPADSRLSDQDIVSAESPTASFTPDVAGEYVLGVIVSDQSDATSADMIITAAPPNNVSPNASAGADQAVQTNTAVTLDASASKDPDSAPAELTFKWYFGAIPSESRLTEESLDNRNSSVASFVPDTQGQYQIFLEVSDGEASDVDEVIITATMNNLRPIARAGEDQQSEVGAHVYLDGSASHDPDNQPSQLEFTWNFSGLPSDSRLSNSDLLNATTMSPSFVPDVAGQYLIHLKVTDGVDTADDHILVEVAATAESRPASPTNLTATSYRSRVNLRWSYSGNDATFIIYRKLKGESEFRPIAQTTDSYYTDRISTAYQSADYYVIAENAHGQSDASTNIQVRINHRSWWKNNRSDSNDSDSDAAPGKRTYWRNW
ncbi:MAG: Ig-like domain-containing protein [Pseudomonadota bacterium]